MRVLSHEVQPPGFCRRCASLHDLLKCCATLKTARTTWDVAIYPVISRAVLLLPPVWLRKVRSRIGIYPASNHSRTCVYLVSSPFVSPPCSAACRVSALIVISRACDEWCLRCCNSAALRLCVVFVSSKKSGVVNEENAEHVLFPRKFMVLHGPL